MSSMSNIYPLDPVIEVFAALVTGVLLIGCLMERRRFRPTDKLLLSIMCINIAVLLTDALYCYLIEQSVPCGTPLLQALMFLNYALSCAIIALYAYYLVLYISAHSPISLWYARAVAIGCAAAALLWFISIFNGMYVYFDENGVCLLGPLFLFSQALIVVLPAATMFIAIKFCKVLGRRDTFIMMSYGLLPILALSLQRYWLTTPLLLAMTLSLVFVYTVVHTEESKYAAEQGKLLAEKELELSESRISIMLSQIQPHFLYNALTAIKHLCKKNDPRAEDAVASFAKYLRSNMDSLTHNAPIPLDKELEHLRNYLAIEQLRFPNIHIIFDISANDFFLPALTVQPMVENAIRYGVTRRENGAGTVTVSSFEDEAAWYVRVADDGVGFDPNENQYDGRSHIGISNTRQRLAAMCGGALSIESEVGVGTTVTIRLPKER